MKFRKEKMINFLSELYIKINSFIETHYLLKITLQYMSFIKIVEYMKNILTNMRFFYLAQNIPETLKNYHIAEYLSSVKKMSYFSIFFLTCLTILFVILRLIAFISWAIGAILSPVILITTFYLSFAAVVFFFTIDLANLIMLGIMIQKLKLEKNDTKEYKSEFNDRLHAVINKSSFLAFGIVGIITLYISLNPFLLLGIYCAIFLFYKAYALLFPAAEKNMEVISNIFIELQNNFGHNLQNRNEYNVNLASEYHNPETHQKELTSDHPTLSLKKD